MESLIHSFLRIVMYLILVIPCCWVVFGLEMVNYLMARVVIPLLIRTILVTKKLQVETKMI